MPGINNDMQESLYGKENTGLETRLAVSVLVYVIGACWSYYFGFRYTYLLIIEIITPNLSSLSSSLNHLNNRLPNE